jgi:hypothetical protein
MANTEENNSVTSTWILWMPSSISPSCKSWKSFSEAQEMQMIKEMRLDESQNLDNMTQELKDQQSSINV